MNKLTFTPRRDDVVQVRDKRDGQLAITVAVVVEATDGEGHTLVRENPQGIQTWVPTSCVEPINGTASPLR